jgi:hypothetical protein
MTVSSRAANHADPRQHEVRLLVDMVRLSRSTLLIAEPGSEKSAVIRSSVMPLLNDSKAGGKTEVAILFDAWAEPPLPALQKRLQQSLGNVAIPPSGAPSDGPSLAASLRALQEALGVTFLFIFDRFDEYLRAPSGRTGFEQFENELVQIIRDPTLRANFLLALDEEAEPLLSRLRERIPRLGYSRVRLPRANGATQVSMNNAPTAEPPPLPFRVAPIAPAAHSSRSETHAPAVAKADRSAQVSAVPTQARAAKAEPSAAKQSSVVRAFGHHTEPASAVQAQEHARKPAIPHEREQELVPQAREIKPEVRTVQREKQAPAHAQPQEAKPELPTQEREKALAADGQPQEQKPGVRTQETGKELEVLAGVREEKANAQTPAKEKAPEIVVRAPHKEHVVRAQPSLNEPTVQPARRDTEPAVQSRKKPVMPMAPREKATAVQTQARQKTGVIGASAEPSVGSKPVPVPRRRQLARLAWVPVVLTVAGAFLFFQVKPHQTADRVADALTKEPVGEKSESAAAPQQSAAVPSGTRKREGPAGAEREASTGATPSTPRVSGGAPATAQPQPEAAVAPPKPAPAASPASTGIAAPSPQADAVLAKSAPAAASAPVPAPKIPPAVRPAESIAQSSPSVTTQPARPSESAVKPPMVAASPSARAPEIALSKPQPSPAIQVARPPELAKPAPVARPQIASSETSAGPRLYINVRNEAQRAWAEQIIRPLAERGIRVAGIRIVSSGPETPDVRYYNLSERDEAIRVAVALRDFGLRAQQLKHVDEAAGQATQRQYELWLGYDQRP